VAVGGDVVLQVFGDTAATTLWMYDVDEDQWQPLPNPPQLPVGTHIGVHGTRLLVGAGSDERGETADYLFDPIANTWIELVDDPFPASYDRQLLSVDGAIILFSKPIAVSSSKPNVVSAARLDDGAQSWAVLPDSDQLEAPSYAESGVAVSPYRGGADGGEVNGWGRTVPYGGWFDATTNTWADLPGGVKGNVYEGGVVGADSAFFSSVSGQVLDLADGTWHDIPTLPGDLSRGYGHTIVAAGTSVFVFGGAGEQSPLSNATWVWRLER
jgi:Galactose oxidase, central domain